MAASKMLLDRSSFGYQYHLSGKQLNIGVLASGEGTNYENIQKLINQGYINAKIACVIYNNIDALVAQKAERYDVQTIYKNHRIYASREAHDQAVADCLLNYQVDLLVMVGWMRISTNKLIEPFENRIINLHPTLLPEFKGNKALEQAYASYQAGNIIKSGPTAHIVTPELDSGPILQQDCFDIPENCSFSEFKQLTREFEYKIFTQAIRMFWIPRD